MRTTVTAVLLYNIMHNELLNVEMKGSHFTTHGAAIITKNGQ